jgi:phage terminase large subunit-like protein
MSALVAAPPYTSDGPAFRLFCHDYVRQTKDRWMGQPLDFEPWQVEFWDEALEVDPATGLRVYQEVILGIPKKNGKSTMASPAGLYLLGMDGQNEPEVYAAAAAKGQARIVMNQSIRMVTRSPALMDIFRVFTYHIECPENGGVFRVISSDAMLQQGINPSGAIIDELHAHKNDDLYTALTNASGARTNPLALTITTAGDDDEGVLGRIYHRMMALPDVEKRGMLTIARDRANGVLMYWYGAPDGADIDDEATWRATNPASWLQDLSYLRKQRNKPTTRARDFMRYHLNMWVPLEDAWIEAAWWRRCADPKLRFDHSLPIGVGVDMGQTHDDTAVAWAQRQGDLCLVRAKVWSNPYPPNHRAHDSWRMPVAKVMDFLRELRSDYPAAMSRDEETLLAVPGPAFAYDPWHFEEPAQALDNEGLNMVLFPQRLEKMGPASTLAFGLVKDGLLRHPDDPVLNRHVSNTTAVSHQGRGWKVAKPKKGTARKNDAAIAMVEAIAMAMQEPPPPPRPRPARLARGF